MEADREGFKFAVNAGYAKEQIGLFYKRLLKIEKMHRKGRNDITKSFADAFSTHPPSKERVVQMNRLSSVTRQSGKPIISTKEFTIAKARAQIIKNKK